MNLPNKLSALMRLALADLAKVENSKKYRVDMGEWHTAAEADRPCTVCFAGAVMAKTLQVPHMQSCSPGEMKQHTRKLMALNSVRTGEVRMALYMIGVPEVKRTVLERRVCPYEDDPVLWRQAMRQIIKELEEHGL